MTVATLSKRQAGRAVKGAQTNLASSGGFRAATPSVWPDNARFDHLDCRELSWPNHLAARATPCALAARGPMGTQVNEERGAVQLAVRERPIWKCQGTTRPQQTNTPARSSTT